MQTEYTKKIIMGIQTCRVLIPEFIKFYLRAGNADYRTARAIRLGGTDFREHCYSLSEIEAVNRFKTLKRQMEWLAGRFAVKKAVASLRCFPLKPDAIEVLNDESGAPYLSIDPGVPVSISHSGDYAAAGVVMDYSTPFGLDIQTTGFNLSRHFETVAFSSAEQQELSGEKASYNHAVYKKWTIKEAYLKYIRKGFAENLKQVEILKEGLFHSGRPVTGVRIYSEFFDGCWFSIVRGG